MKSHAILKTNVALTTNAKIMITGSYSLYIDSIISNTELSSTKYKKKEFNKSNYWDEILPFFYKGTPSEIAFSIKDDDDNKNMSKEFSKQYDDLYQYGARNIIENKDYTEEFEYFAPLHVFKYNLPKNFVIFRVDGPGLVSLDKNNFREEILNRLKCVKVFDLTRNSFLGEWLDTNITKNNNFPQTGLYIDFRNLEFSSWVGIDYEDGGYSEKSLFLETFLQNEQTYQDFEKFIINGYKNNKVVYPHILNLSFLFDDTPATPTSIKTWSLNRYMGFYLDDLEFVKNVSPYVLPKIKSDVIIDSNNLIYSQSNNNPFEETFRREDNPFIEIGGQFYRIEQYFEQQLGRLERVQVDRNTFTERSNERLILKYKIISNTILAGRESEINKNIITVDSDNKISSETNSIFEIENFDDCDVWLIKIDDIFHNLMKKSDGYIYINTDYAFYQTLDKFEYYINDPDIKYRKTISLKVDSGVPPKQFQIYKCKFTDIKDFDLDLVDTEYSKFEYVVGNRITDTDEPKMYAVDQNSSRSPKTIDEFKINGDVVNIPTSSEYVANNSELFRLQDKDLNFLWKKNAQRVKWGFQNSKSSNDYPYLLNNSFTSEDYNRTSNPYNPVPIREERNLDYFLTINTDSNEYLHHSLHVIDDEIIRFENISLSSFFTRLIGISNIGQFSANDIIKITVDSTDSTVQSSYNVNAMIKSIDFSGAQGWRILTDINFVTVSGTVSGTIENLTRKAFNLERYLNVGYNGDYFTYFFGKKTAFNNNNLIKNTEKWSHFNSGDNSTPNITLFRGLKLKIWDVSDININNGVIESVNIKSNNNYDQYKFSILLSRNNYEVSIDSREVINSGTVSFLENFLRWQIIDEWKHDKIYSEDDLVKWNESIYICLTQSQIVNPRIYPFNSSDWQIYSQKNIFWNPDVNGTGFNSSLNNMYELGQNIFSSGTVIPPLVFNFGNYYYSQGISGINFWIPGLTYSFGEEVFFQNKIWKSNFNNNINPPNSSEYTVESSSYKRWWVVSTSTDTIWKTVELWNNQKDYSVTNTSWSSNFTPGHYVIYDDIVYVTTTDTIRGTIPTLDESWRRLYSIEQDTNFQYNFDLNNNFNPIIRMNNRYYFCRQNGRIQTSRDGSETISSLSTLNNGINIFINKKWKNVLINIYVNDNTYTTVQETSLNTIANIKDYLSKTVRDDMYTDIYSKLTANNFMNAINDLSNSYDFSDKIKYIIINEDSSLRVYDFNNLNTVSKLPTLLTCEGPDEFLVKLKSLVVKSSNLSTSQFKAKRQLIDGEINSMQELNYYSDNPLSVTIEKNKIENVKVQNYSGLKNNLYNNLFRHSGNYSPIFHNIELFRNSTLTQSGGNYKFDTELTNFGQIKERIVSKINREKNILKFKDSPDVLSVYPMIDEFGLHTTNSFIFKSTWDFGYHIECREISQKSEITGNESLQSSSIGNGTNNRNLNLL